MLKFTSMTINNFGPYEGEQTIDFGEEDGVTIIWGNNGYGKTTLLNLFRYALFGRFQYRHGTVNDIPKLVNREGVRAGKYGFKVTLHMIYENRQYELTRQYSLRPGVSSPMRNDDYEENVYLKVNGSFVANKEHELAMIMPEEVSRFFLFDGELLQEYEELVKDGTSTGDKIKKSIESILGVPVLTNSARDTISILEEYRKRQTRAAQANKKTQKYASQIEAETASKEEQTKELQRLQQQYDEEIAHKVMLEEKGKQNEHLKELINEMQNLDKDLSQKESTRDNILQQIVVETRNIWQYVISKQTSKLLTQVQHELNALQEKQYKYDSSQQLMNYIQHTLTTHHCDYCDQDVDSNHIEALRNRLEKETGEFHGLTEQEKERMKQFQMRKATLESMESKTNAHTLEVLEKQLADLSVQIDDAREQSKDLRDEIKRYGDVEDLTEATRKNMNDLSSCYAKIQNLEEGLKATKEKIKESDNALANLENKVRKDGSSSVDLNLAIKKVKICEDLNKLFNDGVAAYRNKLKEDVEKDATELFCSISSDKDYTALKINNNYGLSIQHKSGEIISFRSAGYEHIVALSLIGALHKNAPLSGPIIMDSPFGRLDPTHKKNIIKALPQMSNQIILLAYTDEFDKQMARELLGNKLKKEYHLHKYNSFHTEIELQ